MLCKSKPETETETETEMKKLKNKEKCTNIVSKTKHKSVNTQCHKNCVTINNFTYFPVSLAPSLSLSTFCVNRLFLFSGAAVGLGYCNYEKYGHRLIKPIDNLCCFTYF